MRESAFFATDRNSATVTALMLAVLLVTFYALWLVLAVEHTNVDVSWLIVVGQRLLDGERLTVDVMEVNPPFSIWLYMPYLALERLTGLRAETLMTISVMTAGLASIGVSAQILRQGDPFYSNSRMLLLLPFAALVVLCLFPAEVGQREHWALIATLPWIALQCSRANSSGFSAPAGWMPVVAGLCAGLVVMIKPPHFALAFILPSVILGLSLRSWKPAFVAENLIGAVIAALYVGWVLLFDRRFVTEVMPFVAEVYLPLRQPFAALIASWPMKALLLMVLAVIVGGGRVERDASIPLLSSLGFLIAFMAMGKGWPNHGWPMLVLAMWGFAVQLARMDFSHARLSARASAIIGCALIMQMIFVVHRFSLLDESPGTARLAGQIVSVVPQPTVLSLAARLQIAHPLSRDMNARFISRYPSAWAVFNADRLAVQANDAESRRRLEDLRDRLIGDFASEIVAKRPDVILYSDETGTRWNSLMLGDAKIAAALSDYDILQRDGNETVYVRHDRLRQ